MDGGNFSELKYAIDNILLYSDIKLFIICLDPYITKDSGMKSSQINKKEYYSTLGSLFTIKYYLKKYLDLKRGKDSEYYDSYWGYTNNTIEHKDINSTKQINEKVKVLVQSNKVFKINIDNISLNEVSDTLTKIRNKNIKILAYYFPKPKRIFVTDRYYEQYMNYKKKIDTLLDYEKDIIVDFNQDKFDYIRNNDDSYSDGSHLSSNGANKLLKVLNDRINNTTADD